MNLGKQLWSLLKKQKEICWVNGKGTWDRGVGTVEIVMVPPTRDYI